MRRPSFRLSTMTLLVAVIAVMAWLARSRDGRSTLIFVGLIAIGLIAATVISGGINRAFDFLVGKIRRR